MNWANRSADGLKSSELLAVRNEDYDGGRFFRISANLSLIAVNSLSLGGSG